MANPRGEPLSRTLAQRIAGPSASTAAMQALPQGAEARADGAISVKSDDLSLWVYDLDSTAASSSGVIVPTAGTGRWLRYALPGGSEDYKSSVRYATTAALNANTRTGNVILADAVGALGAIDGITGAVGDRLLVQDEVAGADNGIYVIDVIGDGATAYQMTRATDFDTSSKVTAGALTFVSEGTANGDEWYMLTTNDTITLNTTALTFGQIPSSADITSLETRVSTEESTSLSADLSLTTRLSTEESTSLSADASQDVVTSTNLSTSTSAELSLTTRVSTEESTSTSADLSLTTRLSTEESTSLSADTSQDLRTSDVELRLALLATATITSADLTTAGTGPESENIGAVTSDNAVPLVVRLKLTDAFDNGAGVSLAVTVGVTGDTNQFVTAFDAFTGSALEGTGWESGTINGTPDLGFPMSNTQVVATFTAGADQLANFTAGSLLIEVWGLNHS